MKTKNERSLSEKIIKKLESELSNEKKKLQAMIRHAMKEQNHREIWGSITVEVDDNYEEIEPPQTPSNISRISAFSNLQFSESLLSDYETLENDRFKLQQEILCKDSELQELEEKFELMQCKVLKMYQENKTMAQKLNESQNAEKQQEMKEKLKSQVENATQLSLSIEKMSANMSELRNELDRLKKEKKIAFELEVEEDSRSKKCPCKDDDSRKVKLLESQYLNLQSDYCRRGKECKEMVERMKNLLESDNDDKERAVNEALKKRADEMVEEINDNKVFIRELQQQVDVYREKFMKGEIDERSLVAFFSTSNK